MVDMGVEYNLLWLKRKSTLDGNRDENWRKPNDLATQETSEQIARTLA
jgi:hypothetical protein